MNNEDTLLLDPRPMTNKFGCAFFFLLTWLVLLLAAYAIWKVVTELTG